MKIGIDAKWYFEGPPSGRIVIRNIIDTLLTQFDEHHFYIFIDKKFKEQPIPFCQKNVTIIYLWGGINLISNAIVFPAVAWKYRLDVAVFQYFVPLLSNFQSIAFIHDVIFESDPHHFSITERLYFSPMRFISHRAKRICTVSENEKKRLIYYGYGNESNIDVVYNGVATQYKPLNNYSNEIIKTVKQQCGLPERYLLYVGRLNDRKNLKNLIASIRYLEDKSIPLLLFGNYDWKSIDLDEIIHNYDLQHRVFLKGFAPQDDLPIIYSLATVFTFVSYEEGFGLPVLEAMASGVPCVVADTPVFRELFAENVLYTDPYNPRDIAKNIDALVGNEMLHSKHRQQGLEHSAKYRWERTARLLIQSIEKAMS